MNQLALIPGYTGVIGSHAERPIDLPANATDALPDLWRTATDLWTGLADAIGGPVNMLRKMWLSRQAYRPAAGWIRHLELLVRRILLIAALALKLDPAKSSSGERSEAEPRFHPTSPHDPTTWRVSFRLLKRRRKFIELDDAPDFISDANEDDRRHPPRFILTRSLAHRLEALRRAIRYRDDHIRRFARSLARLAERNASGKDNRILRIQPWVYDPDTARCRSVHSALRNIMPLVTGLAARELANWPARKPEPG